MIRLPSTPLLSSSGLRQPQASADAAAAPARALQTVAGAMGQASDQLVSLGNNLARVDNARKLSENRLRLASEYAQFQIDLQNETDPQARISKTQEFLAGQKNSLSQPDFPPDLRDALDSHFTDYATRATISGAQDAANLTRKRATLSFQNEIEEATRTGNRDQYEAAKETASAALGIVPEELERMDNDFDRNTTMLGMANHIEDEPLTALETLQSDSFESTHPYLEPTDRARLIRAAESKIQDMRREEIDILETASLEGSLSPKDIEAASYLTKHDRLAFGKSIDTTTPPAQQDITEAWNITDQLRTFRDDPAVSDGDYRLMHNEARSTVLSMLPPQYQGDIKRELGYLSPAGRSTIDQPARPTDSSDLNSIARSQIKRALDAGMLGDISDEADFATKEKAHRKSEDLRLSLSRFIAANPQASPDMVREHTDQLLGNSIDGDTPLIPAIPAPFSIGNEIDSLLEIPALPPGRENIPPGDRTATDLLLPPK